MGLTEFYSTPLCDSLLSVFTFTATEHSPEGATAIAEAGGVNPCRQ